MPPVSSTEAAQGNQAAANQDQTQDQADNQLENQDQQAQDQGGNQDQGSSDGNSASASAAGDKDGKQPEPGSREALLAVARKAVGKKDDAKTGEDGGASSSSSTENGTDKKNATAKAEGEGDDEDDGQPTDPEVEQRFSKSRRFRKMNAELKELRSFREQVAPDLERYGRITQFMEQNQLQPKEVAEGFAIMAALKAGDAEACMQMLKPHLDVLQAMLGEVLPDDLRAAVEAGEITERHAKELAKARSQAAVSTERAQRVTERQRQDEQRRQAMEQRAALVNAGNAWEARKLSEDTGFAARKQLVMDRAAVILNGLAAQGKAPRTADEAQAILDKADADVLASLKPFTPAAQRKPISTIPSGNRSSTTVTGQPKTLLDAAREGLARARSARS